MSFNLDERFCEFPLVCRQCSELSDTLGFGLAPVDQFVGVSNVRLVSSDEITVWYFRRWSPGNFDRLDESRANMAPLAITFVACVPDRSWRRDFAGGLETSEIGFDLKGLSLDLLERLVEGANVLFCDNAAVFAPGDRRRVGNRQAREFVDRARP